jgi:hypothetical protein
MLSASHASFVSVGGNTSLFADDEGDTSEENSSDENIRYKIYVLSFTKIYKISTCDIVFYNIPSLAFKGASLVFLFMDIYY